MEEVCCDEDMVNSRVVFKGRVWSKVGKGKKNENRACRLQRARRTRERKFKDENVK